MVWACCFPQKKVKEGSASRRRWERDTDVHTLNPFNQGPLNGGVSNGGASRSGLVLPFLSFFGTFPIFPGFSRFARGWSGDFPDSSLFSFSAFLRAPTRNSPKRVCDTIWTFPEKSGKPPGLETPRFSFSQLKNKTGHATSRFIELKVPRSPGLAASLHCMLSCPRFD